MHYLMITSKIYFLYFYLVLIYFFHFKGQRKHYVFLLLINWIQNLNNFKKWSCYLSYNSLQLITYWLLINFTLSYIIIYIHKLFFRCAVHTNARSPLDFCNKTESPAILIDEPQHVNTLTSSNQQNNKPSANDASSLLKHSGRHTFDLNQPSVSTHLEDESEHPVININKKSAYTNGDKKNLGFDLNNFP